MPAFGWSVGDVLASADLLIKTVTVLADAFNAPTEYQAFESDLHSLKAVLQICNGVDRSRFHQKIGAQLNTCLHNCHGTLDSLRDELSLYETALGASQSSSSTSDPVQRMKWAISVGAKITKARSHLSGHIEALILLLQTTNLNGLAKISTRLDHIESAQNDGISAIISGQAGQRDLVRSKAAELFDHVDLKLEALKADLTVHFNANHGEGLEAAADNRALMHRHYTGLQAQVHAEFGTAAAAQSTQFTQIRDNLASFQDDVRYCMDNIPIREQQMLHQFSGLLHANDRKLDARFRSISSVLDKVFRSAELLSAPIPSPQEAQTNAPLGTIQELNLQSGSVVLRCNIDSDAPQLMPILMLLLQGIVQFIVTLLLKIGIKTQLQASRALPMNGADNIEFFDVLGRPSIILDINICLDFDTFHKFLVHHFDKIPGEHFVKRRRYRMLDASSMEVPLDTQLWRKRVKAGMCLYMSIELLSMISTENHCPRTECDGRSVTVHGRRKTCDTCGLEFFTPDWIDQADENDSDDDDLNVLDESITSPALESSRIEDDTRSEVGSDDESQVAFGPARPQEANNVRAREDEETPPESLSQADLRRFRRVHVSDAPSNKSWLYMPMFANAAFDFVDDDLTAYPFGVIEMKTKDRLYIYEILDAHWIAVHNYRTGQRGMVPRRLVEFEIECRPWGLTATGVISNYTSFPTKKTDTETDRTMLTVQEGELYDVLQLGSYSWLEEDVEDHDHYWVEVRDQRRGWTGYVPRSHIAFNF